MLHFRQLMGGALARLHSMFLRVKNGSSSKKQVMTKIPKTFLAISLAAFSLGLVVTFGNFELSSYWTVALPFGAVCFALFQITFIMQNEAAKFDEDECVRRQHARRTAQCPWNAATGARSSRVPSQNGHFIAAPSH